MGAKIRAGIGIASVLNAMPWVTREGGGDFTPRDFFSDIPRYEQTPEDMLAVMKANSMIINSRAVEA